MEKKEFEALPKKEQLKMVYDVLATFAKEHPGAQGEVMRVVANVFVKRKKRGRLDVTFAAQFFESRFEKDMRLTPLEAAVTYMRESKISTVMRPAYLLVARQAKNTVIVRNRRLAAKGLAPLVDTKAENREIPPSIEPQDDDLPRNVRARKKTTRKTPSYREDYRALIESKHSIDDVKQIVNEYSPVWKQIRLARPIELLLDKLAENADWPSMVDPTATGDLDVTEVRGYDKKIYEVLENVSLLDHTYNVLVEAMRILRNHGYDGGATETYGASVITACLAHDLGVADAIRGKMDKPNIDHAVISKWVARAIFDKLFPADKEAASIEPTRKLILDAVENHHMRESSDDTLIATILRAADMAARNYEVTSKRSLHQPSSWGEWFVPEELLAIIEPVVNVLNIRKRNWFDAFNHDNTIYVTKDCMYRAIRKLAKSKDIFDIALVRSSEEKKILTETASCLRAKSMIREADMAEGRWSNYYNIRMESYNGSPIDKASMYLIPLDLEKFSVKLEDFERRKQGLYLADIKGVVPSNKKIRQK